MRGSRYLVATLVVLVACSSAYGESPDAPPIDPALDGGDGDGGENQTDPNIQISATSLDFGDVACGSESPGKLITIQNKGSAPASYKVVLPDGAPFRIEGQLEGTLASQGIVTLQLIAKPGTAGATSSDMVIAAGNGVQTIQPTVRGTGATLELIPAVIDFGDVRMQSGGVRPLEVKNNGTAVLMLSSFETSADFVVSPDPGTFLNLAPGATGIFIATLTPAAVESAPLQATLKPKVTQTLCGAPPSLLLKGKRVNSNVTLSSGDWAKVNCTPQAAARDITISNYSASSLTYTASLAPGSKFTILSGGSGTILSGNATTPKVSNVKVQPNPFGANLAVISEDLTIDISGIAAPEGGMRKVPLKVDVRGAIVTSTPTIVSGFVSNGNTTDTKTFNVTNSGNDLIYLSWNFNRTMGGPAWTYSTPSSLAAGETKVATIGFRPDYGSVCQATLTPVRSGAGAVSCAPLVTVTLQGMKQ